MKKIYFLFVLCVSSQITAIEAQNLEIGGKVGLGFVNLKTSSYFDDNAEATERLTRLQASIVAEYPLSKRFAMDLSLGYAGKGGGDFEEGDELRFGIPDYNRKLEYIGLATLLRFYILKDRQVLPFVQIGPGFSYLLSAKALGNKIDDEFLRSKFDISSNVGVGIKCKVNTKLRLELLGNWERGWSKTIRQGGESLFNEAFAIALGCKFAIR